MPIVIAGGQSVTDYTVEDLTFLCRFGFVFAVNDSCFKYPCDVVVACDYKWIVAHAEQLKKLDKPIITRKWDGLEKCGLQVYFIPNESVRQYPLSGMVACKISDKMAATVEKKSYVIGMDATAGHYYDDTGRADRIDVGVYEKMGLTNTVNLGIHSRISCWPKASKLPHPRKVLVHATYRVVAAAWACGNPGAHL